MKLSLNSFLQLSTGRNAMENKTKKVLGSITTSAVLSPLGFRRSVFHSSMRVLAKLYVCVVQLDEPSVRLRPPLCVERKSERPRIDE